MLLTILIVLLILSLAGGSWGYTRYGFTSLSPAGIILIAVGVLWFTGHLWVR
jgi:hypothetical protein